MHGRAAVQCLQKTYPDVAILIYCSPESTPDTLAAHAKSRFNLSIQPNFRIVPLHNRDLLDPSRYRKCTMLRQAWASIVVASTALRKCVPEFWVDTTGWAFPYPLVYILGSTVISYTHYPTISTDMLSKVSSRETSFNNPGNISQSYLKSQIKLLYYHIFAHIYGICGGFSMVTMVNSSWTKSHIEKLWWTSKAPYLVYPPCDSDTFQDLPLDRKPEKTMLVSVAQFRPEKNHYLQLETMALLRQRALTMKDVHLADLILQLKLVLVGGCRGDADLARIVDLKKSVEQLGLDSNIVEFNVNVPFLKLRDLLGNAIAGIHTMENEHFGIGVVEYMAAGAIPIAHNSGGPKEDIVVNQIKEGGIQNVGYLCATPDEYCDAIIEILGMKSSERLKMAAAGRSQALKFSDASFQSRFINVMKNVIHQND